jgi:hypothetical protein
MDGFNRANIRAVFALWFEANQLTLSGSDDQIAIASAIRA